LRVACLTNAIALIEISLFGSVANPKSQSKWPAKLRVSQNTPTNMNTNRFSSLLAFGLLAANVTWAQNTATTTPVGYVTKTLPASQFSFVGLTVHHPVLLDTVATDVSATTVSASGVNFDNLLGVHSNTSPTYIIELADGTISEVSNWNSAGLLTVGENLTESITPNTTTFKLRKASTVSDVFGATNSVGLKADVDGDYAANADLIYIIGAGGTPTIVYYYDDGSTQGWYTANGDDASQLPIIYADGFYIKRQQGSSLNLVMSGEVKNAPTKGVLIKGYNFLSSVAPVGATLGNSGLSNFLSPDTTGDYQASSVDNVLIPQANGSFILAYYYNDGDIQGWYTAAGDDATNIALDGAFIVLNRGNTKPYTIAIPNYTGL
jgi:hypothetical protein